MDSACLEMEEKVCLKLWVKLGCSPRCTQIVPKWHLDGQVAGRDFFNTRVRCDAHQKSPFSPGANLGGFGLLRNGGKGVFEIMGQAGVLPAMYPNSAKRALGWPSGRKGFFQHAREPLDPEPDLEPLDSVATKNLKNRLHFFPLVEFSCFIQIWTGQFG